MSMFNELWRQRCKERAANLRNFLGILSRQSRQVQKVERAQMERCRRKNMSNQPNTISETLFLLAISNTRKKYEQTTQSGCPNG